MDSNTLPSPREQLEAARAVRPHAPTWLLGIEEPGTARSLASGVLEFSASRPELAPLARSLARWAFQRRPLQAQLAATMAALEGGSPCSEMARLMHSRLDPPEGAESLVELLASGQSALVARHLPPLLRDPATSLAWLAVAWDGLLRLPGSELCPAMLRAAPLPRGLGPLADRLEAEWGALHLPPDEALELAERVCPERFDLWRSYLMAELLLRDGRREEGTRALSALWRRMAWHPQLTLKLDTLLHPLPAPRSDLSDVAVLLYSWNKADLLEQTLANLERTELGRAHIFLLDNGSTDRMPEVLRSAAERFGPQRFSAVTLPVNVGAPAARNWLLSLEAVQARRWAAFLDDDVILPEDWLQTLVAAAEREEREEGGPVDVVGCRITSADTPATLQSADYHLLPPSDSVKTFVNYQEIIAVFENCGNDFDLGLFSYTRPATSVSGCCHLVSMDSVREHGPFDIRFSPTQFDDLERDMRLNRAGLRVHYAGEMAVRHVQHSSLARSQSLTSIGHVFGNKIKLEGKFTPEEIVTMQQDVTRRLEADLKRREDRLLDELT